MRILAVLDKEWVEALHNKLLLYTSIVPPLMFVVIQLVVLWEAGQRAVNSLAAVEPYLRQMPMLSSISPRDAMQLVVANQFMLFFLITPALIPLAIATHSIIGEKQARSLEPLLATPIETWELLLGKIVAAVLPGVLATWMAYGLYIVGTFFLASRVVTFAALDQAWLIAILGLAPLVGICTTCLAVIVSARVNDARTAQQIGGLVVLPIVALLVAQMAGKFLLSASSALILAILLVALVVVLLFVATRLFQRESILVNWR